MPVALFGLAVEQDISQATPLIREARSYDSVYSSGLEVSQPNAIKKYEEALNSNPSNKERLEILSRLAALTSYCFDVKKGERPDFAKSVSYSQEVFDNYPTDEPKVYEAIISMTCGNTAQKKFVKAIECAKHAFEYDTSVLGKELEEVMFRYNEINGEISKIDKKERMAEGPHVRKLAAEQAEQRSLSRQIKDKKKLIEKYQYHTVDQLSYAAIRVSPLMAETEMRSLIKQFPDTHIAKRATEKLNEIMAKYPDMLAPGINEMPGESFAEVTTSPVAIDVAGQDSAISPQVSVADESKGKDSVKTDQNIKLDNENYHPKQSRASPYAFWIKFIAVATAILVIASVAMWFYKNNKTLKEYNHE